jgi:hypothetical protein
MPTARQSQNASAPSESIKVGVRRNSNVGDELSQSKRRCRTGKSSSPLLDNR